jgi:hypothetical protein
LPRSRWAIVAAATPIGQARSVRRQRGYRTRSAPARRGPLPFVKYSTPTEPGMRGRVSAFGARRPIRPQQPVAVHRAPCTMSPVGLGRARGPCRRAPGRLRLRVDAREDRVALRSRAERSSSASPQTRRYLVQVSEPDSSLGAVEA